MFPLLTVGMPGTEKWSLGAPKNGAFAALERQKCLCCGAEKTGGAEVYRKSQFLSLKQWIARCHVEAKHEVVVVSLACFAAFPECFFCSHWFAECAEPPRVYGSRSCEGEGNCFQLQ